MKKYKVTFFRRKGEILSPFILTINDDDIDSATRVVLNNSFNPHGCFIAHASGQRSVLLSKEVVSFDIEELKDV